MSEMSSKTRPQKLVSMKRRREGEKEDGNGWNRATGTWSSMCPVLSAFTDSEFSVMNKSRRTLLRPRGSLLLQD